MTDISAAKQTAKRLFKKYNFQNGPLGSYQISSLLKEIYEYLQIPFTPTQNDIKGFEKVLDIDNDGKVTLNDLQAISIEYLCGSNQISKGRDISQQAYNYQQNTYGMNNIKKDFQQPMENSYESHSGYNYKMKSLGGAASEYSYGTDSGYNFTQTYTKDNVGQPSWQNYNEVKQSIDNTYHQSTNIDSNQAQTYELSNSYQEQQQQQYQNNDRPYSDLVRQYLSIVGQVFMKYADSVAYTVTQNEVPDLLTDTYAVLGRQGYYPTNEDVKAWMKLCDVNRDGKVEYQDYEFFVVKSLERSGMDLYD